MTGKDPKDMTAAELLRWAANGEDDEHGNHIAVHKLVSALSGMAYEETGFDRDRRNILALADKIDAEIEAARSNHLAELVESCIEMHGYTSRHEGERFDRWIERCFIPRPRYDDGEPVQFGDDNIDWEDTDECRAPGTLWGATAVDERGRLLATTHSEIVAVAKTDERGRVKRRAPDTSGADGLPVVAGETVWLTREGAAHAGEFSSTGDEMCGLRGIKPYDRLTVTNARFVAYGSEFVAFRERAAWCPASWLTHEEPETQERIDEDAQKSTPEYWGCRDASCECCPAETDGKTPRGRFDTRNCQQAQLLDLLRRQRELDKRMGGE